MTTETGSNLMPEKAPDAETLGQTGAVRLLFNLLSFSTFHSVHAGEEAMRRTDFDNVVRIMVAFDGMLRVRRATEDGALGPFVVEDSAGYDVYPDGQDEVFDKLIHEGWFDEDDRGILTPTDKALRFAGIEPKPAPVTGDALTVEGWLVTHADGELRTIGHGSERTFDVEIYTGDNVQEVARELASDTEDPCALRRARMTLQLLDDTRGITLPDDETGRPRIERVVLSSPESRHHHKGVMFALRSQTTGEWLTAPLDQGDVQQPICFVNADDAAEYIDYDGQLPQDVEIVLMNPREAMVKA